MYGHQCKKKWKKGAPVERLGSGFWVMGILGLFFLVERSFMPGMALLGIAVYHWLKWMSDPARPYWSKIETDAAEFDARIPEDRATRLALLRLYKKYERTRKLYPSLEGTYRSLMEGLWQALASIDLLSEYRHTVENLLDSWPIPEDGRPGPILSDRIRKARQAVREWEAAHREVYDS